MPLEKFIKPRKKIYSEKMKYTIDSCISVYCSKYDSENSRLYFFHFRGNEEVKTQKRCYIICMQQIWPQQFPTKEH